MSTRVQKGGTVFRPVTKARSHVVESTSRHPSISRDNHAVHLPSEMHKISLSIPPEDVTAIISKSSAVLSPLVLRGTIDRARQEVPITISSSRAITPTRGGESGLPPTIEENFASEGPFYAEVPITERNVHPHSRRSRSESLAAAPKKYRKVRRPETTTFDTNTGPGEDLDPTSVTMAALCQDTGQGRVSSKAAQILDNHLSWKKSNREKRTRMRTLMEAKKYGKNVEDDTASTGPSEALAKQTLATDSTPGPSSTQPASGHISTVEDASGQGFDYSQNVSTSRYNVQVRIGPNGETIVDEESLFVDRNAEGDTAGYTHVEESDVTKFVNSATYSKRFRGTRWSAEETELFYDALSQFGENYELISYVLPGRDRKACKNKFKAEDKKSPQRVNYCLNNRKPYDMETLSRMTGKDFSGPTPEIRAPETLSLAETLHNSETSQFPRKIIASTSSSSSTQPAEEVVGDISSFNPE